MHPYRDSIRTAEGEIAVSFAAILYPGEGISCHTGLKAIRAYPGQENHFCEILDPNLTTAL